ncbi:MAG: uroporphyrinogen decarboxylase family protein [Planctomycetota bacterium]
MTELTSCERVIRVLDRQQPDRIPHFEWLFAKNVREAIYPGCKSHNDFAVKMGHDAVLVGPDFKKEQVGQTQWRSEWGYVDDYGNEEHGVEVESPIKEMSDFENYSPPDPHAPGRYETVEWAVKEFKNDKAIGVHLNDVFSIPRSLMGMEKLLMTIALDPELVKALVDMSVEINLAMAKEVAARGADFIWTGDDYACNTGPMMSPDHFRDLFYPGLCRVIGGFRELGLPVIKHTDGYLWSIIDMIIDSGISCLDPIDPQAGMDLSEVKGKYSDRIALKGNVDCAQTLSYATVDEVIEETKEVIRKGAPGGGFILSSSNSIHASVKPENYLAMHDTLKKYGSYPLRL